MYMLDKIQRLRKEVANMQRARKAGSGSFEQFAARHGSKVYRIRYNQLQGIVCDTMAVYNGRTVITHENLQYFPAKVRFYYTKL